MTNPTPHGQVPEALRFTEAHVQYVARYGGNCRDCADENGVCPGSGLPCADARKAIEFVFDALAYGVSNGYIASPFPVAHVQKPDKNEHVADDLSKNGAKPNMGAAYAELAYLCKAWGETDLPSAAIVRSLDGVRAFLVEQWLGSADSAGHDGEPILPAVMAEMHEDWEREGQAFEWSTEFEIGGISVQRVDDAARASNGQAPAGAAPALARVILDAKGKAASKPYLTADKTKLDAEMHDAMYPHRAPHRVAELVEPTPAAQAAPVESTPYPGCSHWGMRDTPATAQPAPATQQAGIPGNFITHRAAWRKALERCKITAANSEASSYWEHEIAAFDRSFDRLWTLMQDAPQPSPTAQADSQPTPATQQVGGGVVPLDVALHAVEYLGMHNSASRETEMVQMLRKAAQPSPTAQAAESVPAGDWTQPTTVAQRLADAVQLLCGGKRPPDAMVHGWLDHSSEELQSFAASHGPSWAQGIGLIDAAMVMVDQPTEITTIDHQARDHERRAARAPADSVLKDHQIAALVNELRDIAVQYHGTQQLRERIAQVVVPILRAADSVLEDAARWRALQSPDDDTVTEAMEVSCASRPSVDDESYVLNILKVFEAAARKQGANHD
jgi:hypothetical protein